MPTGVPRIRASRTSMLCPSPASSTGVGHRAVGPAGRTRTTDSSKLPGNNNNLAETISGGDYENDIMGRARRAPFRMRRRVVASLGAGQAGDAAVLALGAAAASDARRRGRLGGVDRQGLERHDQDHDLSGPAARQGVRPLQHGARRHRRHLARQSGLRARPLPDRRGGRTALHLLQLQGGQRRDGRVVSPLRRHRR